MNVLFRSHPRPVFRRHVSLLHRQHYGTLSGDIAVRCVHDRGLDLVVMRERNLKHVLSIKNFIKSEPSKSLPASIINQSKDSLGIPFRPIEFARKYPSIFQEYLPGGVGIHPHFKLTPDLVCLDSEEQLVYQTETFTQDAANRLLKLLMIGRINKFPLALIEKVKFDLGLPQDYVKTIVPQFPDYFRVTDEQFPMLELVCWSNEVSISSIEKKAANAEKGNEKGSPIAFPLHFSKGFEIDKKYKRWLDEWQKLPYVSPYENAMHLAPKSIESDKWAVAVLHEVLSLFVTKKAEKDCVLALGEHFGLRSRFKSALLDHPGIFYVSNKNGMHTVVLKDAYKRGLLVKKNALIDVRSKYVHLMNINKKESQSENVHHSRKTNVVTDSKELGEDGIEVDRSENDEKDEMYDSSNSDVDVTADDYMYDNAMDGVRVPGDAKFKHRKLPRATSPSSGGKKHRNVLNKNQSSSSRRSEYADRNAEGRSMEGFSYLRTRRISNVRNSTSNLRNPVHVHSQRAG